MFSRGKIRSLNRQAFQALILGLGLVGGHAFAADQPKTISNPKLSPNGKWLAYVQEVAADQEVYIAEVSGRTPINISNNRGRGKEKKTDVDPVWSPDSTRLMYSTDRSGTFDLAIYDVETRQTKFLASEDDSDERNAVWSPNGNAVAFCAFYKSRQRKVYILDLSTETRRPLTDFMNLEGADARRISDKESCYPSWSPDGTALAFWAFGDIHKVDFSKGETVNLTAPLIGSSVINDTAPIWSPKGGQIAFIGRYQGFSSEVYVLDAKGSGEIHRITDNFFEDLDPQWSSNGDRLVYSSYAPGNVYERIIPETRKGDDNTFATYSPPGKLEIFTATPDGKERKRLTNNHYHDKSPVFSADGTEVIFVRQIGQTDRIMTMDLNGESQSEFFTSPSNIAQQ